MIELICGDVISTYKKPSNWNIPQQFFDSRIVIKSYEKYGWLCNFPECNHARIYLGKDNFGVVWVFEYTFPVARFVKFQPWMVDPTYARIYRMKLKYMFNEDELFSLAMSQAGSIYDFTQLIDMYIGWGRVLDLGKTNRVCSTGARWVLETVTGMNFFPDTQLRKTLPCAFANSDNFECVNTVDGIDYPLLLQPEPKIEREAWEG